ncbi:hypothetical protein JS533_007735 [Bifidobacterium amazonense]|uniref:Choice-of-anchor A family protein n=1 Tax=Bifidobacterium amazonense TaxID=2809027 RepID=A0ABS9VVQ4_9BIFI|nr:hypothetical protein [Bifidobacterium amazonense]MCH9276159.1 hypothetical protein [Bifidobacterium amazonense]
MSMRSITWNRGGIYTRRLAASALAISMMLGTALTGIITAPIAAYADNGSDDGALCTPTEQSMGTDANPASDRDSGVATWVGGNMYVGRKPTDTAAWTNGTGPDGSYAVEAEGLTVVNGKLMMNPLKNSWSGAGFRFGIAGFGTQFTPAKNSTTLVVGGNTNDTSLPDWSNVQAWTHSGFLRENGHIASIAGASSDRWGAPKGTLSLDKNPANTDASVNWNVTDPMENVTVKSSDNDTDTSDDIRNLSESEYYQDYVVDDISAPLAFQTATGTVSQGVSTLSTLTRHKYNYYDTGKGDASSIEYVFNYNDDTKNGTGRGLETTDSYTNREKLITFTGTNNPTMEVFNLDASMLTDYIGTTRYRGVAFAFTNIADTASIVINVTGSSENISFHNGWQFWWNGQEISDGTRTITGPAKTARRSRRCTRRPRRRSCGTSMTRTTSPSTAASPTRAPTSTRRTTRPPRCSAASS